VVPIIAALSRQIIEDLLVEYRGELTAIGVAGRHRTLSQRWRGIARPVAIVFGTSV